MKHVSENKTAILLFARSVKEENKFKKLSRNTSDNYFLLKALEKNAFEIADKSSLPIFHFNEARQYGSTFGERITNSIDAIFSRGFKNVIVIGGDCPDISVSDIRQAESFLDNGLMAVGPDQRGGTFLLGLTAEMFDLKKLEALHWSTSGLIESINEYAGQLEYTVGFLNQKFDLNVINDVTNYAGESLFLMTLLEQLYKEIVCKTYIYLLYDCLSFPNNQLRRGPPLMRATY